MPNMRDAMQNAGLRTSSASRKCEACGREFAPRLPEHKYCSECVRSKGGSAPSSFPAGYPDYFDSDGFLRCEYLTDLAQNIAHRLGTERPKMTMHQLRAFYGHVKRLDGSLKNGRPFKEVYPEICKLKPFAEERSAKEKIPRYFADFICRNVDKTKDQKSFQSGFVEHFQAVVAYCTDKIK